MMHCSLLQVYSSSVKAAEEENSMTCGKEPVLNMTSYHKELQRARDSYLSPYLISSK